MTNLQSVETFLQYLENLLVQLFLLPFPPRDAVVWWIAGVVVWPIQVTAPTIGEPPEKIISSQIPEQSYR